MSESYVQGARPSSSPDPWKHRSAGMVCSTCMWYVPKVVIHEVDKPEIVRTEVGRCRRHAPTFSGFPIVKHNDWCGDHRLDENKT